MTKERLPEIQILIAAYGPEALARISSLSHPACSGLKYLVSWQNYGSGDIPEDLNSRNDFEIILSDTKGVAVNRNNLIYNSDKNVDFLLMSDDDVSYSEQQLETLFSAIKLNKDVCFLTFKYYSETWPKQYPSFTFDLNHPPKNYYVGGMEIGWNVKKIKERFKNLDVIFFHPAFGINGELFSSAEEPLLIKRMLNEGLSGRFIPEFICTHEGNSTMHRSGLSQGFIETKGASILYLKPKTWFLRMIVHAYRAQKGKGAQHIPFMRYCKWWLRGVRRAKKNNVFKSY